MHDTQTTKRSNSNRFHLNSNYQYRNKTPSSSHFISHINQPETQAQLVAFTPPLMSIQLPHQEVQIRQRNYHSTRPYMQNQQSSFPMKSKSETAIQPEYYVDSFASNFSDKPTSNSNNKTKTKHVTFQEPDMTKSVFSFLDQNLILIYLVNHQKQTQILPLVHHHYLMVRTIHHLLGHHQFLCMGIHVHLIDITILIIIILTMSFTRHIII
jgi:hypothetical protein